MGQILQNWRVLIAALFAVVLIAGSFMLARGIESPPLAQASAESALLQAIASKDSDNDGLPDWEEALYGTDSHNPDSFKLGMTDGEAVARGLIVPKAIADISVATSSPSASASIDPSLPPAPAEGTLTAAFAKNFFTLYVAAKQNNGGADLSETDMQNIANQALSLLSSSITPAPDFKTAKDITVSGSGPDAMKAFGASAEMVLLKNTSDAKKSEVLYLQDALQKNDMTALPHIASIAKGYRDSAIGLAVLPVPRELAAADLALVNALMRTSQIITDFARADTDPLATMLALQQYLPATQALGAAFITIGDVYATAGVSVPADSPGASFVNLISDVTASQQTSAPKP